VVVVVVAVKQAEQGLLAKETLVEMVEVPTPVVAVEAVPELSVVLLLVLMEVSEVLEFLLQLLELLYTTPVVAGAVKMGEVTELEVTVAEALGQLLQMLLMALVEVEAVSLQVQTPAELEETA
tara:strand:+ start:348 stop:716 length:369 start_codon:yes stop_codon:yes gene_type:complete